MDPGWFGEPWWGYVCYDEAGRLREEARVPFPHGRSCLWCGEPFGPADSGVQTPCIRAGGATVEYMHQECHLRSGVGSVAHLEGRCSCFGGAADEDGAALTARQDALASWDWVHARGRHA